MVGGAGSSMSSAHLHSALHACRNLVQLWPSRFSAVIRSEYRSMAHGFPVALPRAQQSRFSFVSCSPEDGNRINCRNVVVLINSDNEQF
jgi:hypothetical protein